MNTETVTVVRPPGKDAFGDPLPDSGSTFEVGGCMFAPGPSNEPGFAANTVDTDATVYAPPAADFRATDLVIARGDTYTVVGKPQVWAGFGVVVALRQTTG